jgi:hypothetical protein
MKLLRFSWDLCFLQENVSKIFPSFLPVEPALKLADEAVYFVVCETKTKKQGFQPKENFNNLTSYVLT